MSINYPVIKNLNSFVDTSLCGLKPIILLLILFHCWLLECFHIYSCILFTKPCHFVSTNLLSGTKRCSQCISYFFHVCTSKPQKHILGRRLVGLTWEWYLETKIFLPGGLSATGVSLFLDHLRSQDKQICMYYSYAWT